MRVGLVIRRLATIAAAGLIAVSVSARAATAAGGAAAQSVVPTKDQVLQKIRFARMLATQSKLSYRLSHSSDERAQRMLQRAREGVEASQKAVDGGDLTGAARRVDTAIHLLTEAAQRLPKRGGSGDDGLRYKELLDTVTTFKASYDRNYRRMVKVKGKGAVPAPLDEEKFGYLMQRARADAKGGELVKANRLLAAAEERVTKALTVLLKGQTLVYTKSFDSPRDEYQYESRRNKSYADLIPQALGRHKTTQRARELVRQFVDLGKSMKSHAVTQARDGDYQGAVKTMKASTSQLQRALWIAGVRWSRWPE